MLRSDGVDIDATKTLDIEDAFDVQHVQRAVPAERDRARALSLLDAVIEKLEVHVLVRPSGPREEQLRHPHVRFDAVGKRIVDGLVSPELESSIPCALYQRFRRCDHEEQ